MVEFLLFIISVLMVIMLVVIYKLHLEIEVRESQDRLIEDQIKCIIVMRKRLEIKDGINEFV